MVADTVINDLIYSICTRELGQCPPSVHSYSNGVCIGVRNADGDRVGAWFDYDITEGELRLALQSLYKVKLEALPSAKAMAKFKAGLSMQQIVAHRERLKEDAERLARTMAKFEAHPTMQEIVDYKTKLQADDKSNDPAKE